MMHKNRCIFTISTASTAAMAASITWPCKKRAPSGRRWVPHSIVCLCVCVCVCGCVWVCPLCFLFCLFALLLCPSSSSLLLILLSSHHYPFLLNTFSFQSPSFLILQHVIGWFRMRRNTPLVPSLYETIVHNNLLDIYSKLPGKGEREFISRKRRQQTTRKTREAIDNEQYFAKKLDDDNQPHTHTRMHTQTDSSLPIRARVHWPALTLRATVYFGILVSKNIFWLIFFFPFPTNTAVFLFAIFSADTTPNGSTHAFSYAFQNCVYGRYCYSQYFP